MNIVDYMGSTESNTPSGRQNYVNPQGLNVPDLNQMKADKKEEDKKNIFGHIGDVGKGLMNSPLAFIDSSMDFLGDVVEFAGKHTGMTEEGYETGWGTDYRFFDDLGTAGQVAERVAEFGIGMVALSGLNSLNIIKNGGKIARGVLEFTKGASVNLVLADREEGLISDILAETPVGARLPFLEFMRGDIEEDDMAFRMKAAFEGGVLDLATFGAFKGLAKVAKLHIGTKHAGDLIGADAAAKRMAGLDGDNMVPTPKKVGAEMVADMGQTDMSVASAAREPSSTISSRFHQSKKYATKVDGAIEEALSSNSREGIASVLDDFLTAYDDVGQGLTDMMKHLHKFDLHQDNMEGVETMLQTIAKMTDMYDGAVKETWEQTAQKAQSAIAKGQITAKSAVRDIAKSEEGATLVHKWRLLRDQSAEELNMLLPRLNSLDLNTSEGLKEGLDLVHMLEGHIAIHKTSKRVSAGAARANRANAIPTYRIAIDGEKILTKNLNSKTLSRIQADSALNIETKKRITEAQKLYRNIQKKGSITKALDSIEGAANRSKVLKGLDVLHAWRVSSMLSGGSTHLRNGTGSGVTFAITNMWESTLGATFGALAKDADRTTFRAVGAGIMGFHDGAMDFWKSLAKNVELNGGWGNMLKNADARDAAISTSKLVRRDDTHGLRVGMEALKDAGIDTESTLGGAVAKVLSFFGNVNDMASMSVMGLTDGVQGGGGFRASVSREIQNDITLHSLTGQKAIVYKGNLENAVDAIRNSHGKMLRTPTTPAERALAQRAYEVYETSERFAKEGLHQLELEGLPKKISSLTNADNATSKVVKTLFFPFQKTGMNLVQFVSDRTIISPFKSKHMRDSLSGALGLRAKRTAQAKLTTGTLLYAGAGQLYLSGNLTGSIARDDREVAEASGVQPYSIKVGNQWVQYTTTEPMGTFLGLMADFYTASEKAADEESTMAGVAHVVMSLADLAADKTYMKGMSDLMQLIENPDYRLENFAGSFLSTMAPLSGTSRWLTRSFAPELKETVDVFSQVKGLYPNELPQKTDAFGRPMTRSHLSAVLGLRISEVAEEDDARVSNELRRLNAFPTDREGSFKGVKLTEDEHREAKRLMYEHYGPYDRLKELVGSDAYRKASDGKRAKALNKIMTNARKVSRRMMFEKDPEAKARFLEEKRSVALNDARRGLVSGSTTQTTQRSVRRESQRRRASRLIDVI